MKKALICGLSVALLLSQVACQSSQTEQPNEPAPTQAVTSTPAPEPTTTPKPTVTPEPPAQTEAVPEPSETMEPETTPEPTPTPAPAETPAPTPAPEITSNPTQEPKPETVDDSAWNSTNEEINSNGNSYDNQNMGDSDPELQAFYDELFKDWRTLPDDLSNLPQLPSFEEIGLE